MKIAIQAADLDAERIDGTRVYILNLLKNFGKIDASDEFLIYHKKNFNPQLVPPDFSNYRVISLYLPKLWTQTLFAFRLFRDRPEVLWMPMHNIPYFRPKKTKTIVTIHDLAFKYFPETFTKINLLKINLLTKLAVSQADKIITISQSSKRDILKFYPQVPEHKIAVIYHGFDKDIFSAEKNLEEEARVKKNLGIAGQYILYVGAIQPRKNLEVLVAAFEELKKGMDSRVGGNNNDLKLVLAGEKAWLAEDVFTKIENSKYKADIITPGKIKFEDLGHLMRGAEIFCFPSLYEGFGIPILEAFASRVPVVCSSNSSLPEVAGDAALYFDGRDAHFLAKNLISILEDAKLREELIAKGLIQMQKFSWEKCAHATLEYLKK